MNRKWLSQHPTPAKSPTCLSARATQLDPKISSANLSSEKLLCVDLLEARYRRFWITIAGSSWFYASCSCAALVLRSTCLIDVLTNLVSIETSSFAAARRNVRFPFLSSALVNSSFERLGFQLSFECTISADHPSWLWEKRHKADE